MSVRLLAVTMALWPVLAAQAVPLAVMVSSRRTGSQDAAAAVATKVKNELKAALNQPVLGDAEAFRKAGRSARDCKAVTKCVAEVAQAIGPDVVLVGVDVARIGSTLAVALEAVTAQAPQSILAADFTVSQEGLDGALTRHVSSFSAELAAKLRERWPPPSAASSSASSASPSSSASSTSSASEPSRDTPLATASPSLKPRETVREPTQEIVAQSSAPRLSPARWVLLGLGVTAGVVATIFGALAANGKRQVDATLYCESGQPVDSCGAGSRATSLTYAEYAAAADKVNVNATVSVLSGSLGVGLLAVGIALFAVPVQ